MEALRPWHCGPIGHQLAATVHPPIHACRYRGVGKAADGWGILFSHPADFTPVCTTELGAVAKLRAEFDKRNTKVIALSVDPLDAHEKWIGDINETQKTNVNFPLIADPKFEVAKLYDMIHPEVSDKFTVRSVFVIGPDKKVKLTITYPAATGRNFDEIIRVIDSLQLRLRLLKR
jgi:alkyl hydroperoxide reductase subunit AhpC